jgi:hypothetical protein
MIRAAEIAKQRLRIAAQRLGTQDPVQHIGGLLDRTFDLPIGDPRYGNNSLLPGHLPLETSFSETSRDALRIDMEPLGPLVTPHARVHEVSREARRLVAGHYGDAALRWFDERSEAFRGSRLHGASRKAACRAWCPSSPRYRATARRATSGCTSTTTAICGCSTSNRS